MAPHLHLEGLLHCLKAPCMVVGPCPNTAKPVLHYTGAREIKLSHHEFLFDILGRFRCILSLFKTIFVRPCLSLRTFCTSCWDSWVKKKSECDVFHEGYKALRGWYKASSRVLPHLYCYCCIAARASKKLEGESLCKRGGHLPRPLP